MNIVKKIEKKAERAADLIPYEVTYIPGETEDLDQYKATSKEMEITCYGSSRDSVIKSAKMEAIAILMQNSKIIDLILKNEDLLLNKKKNKVKTG